MSETTREIDVPVAAVLRRAAWDLGINAERLRRAAKRMKPGAVQEAVHGVILRVTAGGEVLASKAAEIEEHWPKEERGGTEE